MDGQRFDDLTKVLATTSRRQVVKALAGGVASGLLALLSGQEAGAASCRGRPDFTPCGECKHCRNGRCVAGFDGLNCRTCGTCQDGRCRGDDRRCGECQRCRGHGRRCVPDPRQDLHPCGSDCHVCDGTTGACTPLDDGSACFTRDDGTCCGGVCTTEACCPACPQCQRCEDGACVPDRGQDDQPCAGTECGACFLGECRPNDTRCPDPCTICDEVTLTCVPLPEGAACGGECGTCQNGQCLPQGSLCVERHGPCSSCDAETLTCTLDPDGTPCGNEPGHLECNTCQGGACMPVSDGTACAKGCGTCDGGVCVPVPDGTQCGVECGTCQDGQCLPQGGLCTQQHGPCSFCDAQTLTCVPADDGEVCSSCGTCQGGSCVPDDSRCPVGERCCPDRTCQPENCPCPGASGFATSQVCCAVGQDVCGDECCDPGAGEFCTGDGCCPVGVSVPCCAGEDCADDPCCGPNEHCCLFAPSPDEPFAYGYCCPGAPNPQLQVDCCLGGCCPAGYGCDAVCGGCCPLSSKSCDDCIVVTPGPGRRARVIRPAAIAAP